MNWTTLVIAFHILIVINLEVRIMAKPAHQRQQQRNKKSSDGKRAARSGRKLRMLHKILKRLTPEDVWQLTRPKKEPNEEYEQNLTSQILGINFADQQSSTSDVPGK